MFNSQLKLIIMAVGESCVTVLCEHTLMIRPELVSRSASIRSYVKCVCSFGKLSFPKRLS